MIGEDEGMAMVSVESLEVAEVYEMEGKAARGKRIGLEATWRPGPRADSQQHSLLVFISLGTRNACGDVLISFRFNQSTSGFTGFLEVPSP